MLTFYKPNKSVKGSLINFNLAAGKADNDKFREGAVFVKMLKQTAWDDAKHTGSFKGGDQLSLKLNLIELGKMLSVIERKEDKFNTFHKGYDQNVSILFSVWKDKASGADRGLGLQVTKEKEGTKTQFAIGFQLGEDIVLREFIKVAMEHILLANYANDKRMFKSAADTSEAADAPAEGNELVDDGDSLFE